MNDILLKALVAFVPACVLLTGSMVRFFKERNISSLLQLIGAGCLIVVVLAHFCEAIQLLPGMHWGEPHSTGHYLDFCSAGLGLTLFPAGYLFHAVTRQSS
jgi:hypothetical protein